MRHRITYACCIALVVAIGLMLHFRFNSLSGSKAGGDALWALMEFFGFGFLFPRMRTSRLTLIALAFAFSVETSQLYHAEWIDAVRQTRLGALALGAEFHWPDFAAYTVGIAAGAIVDLRLMRSQHPRKEG